MKHFSRARRFGHVAAFHARGVTLIELMVVTAIVAILAAIAYPSYMRYVARTHRNAAAACLSQIAQAMERRYTSTLTYVDPDGNEEDALACTTADDLDRFYAFSFPDDDPVTQSTFIIQAEPTEAQADADVDCGTLTLDNTGARGSENNDRCW